MPTSPHVTWVTSFSGATLNVDAEKLRTVNQNRREGVADGRMLEPPDSIAADLDEQDQAARERLERGTASAERAPKTLKGLGLGRLKVDGAFEPIVAHVDERQRRLAVAVETVEDFLKELLALLHELSEVIRVQEEVLREEGVGEAPGRFRDKPAVSRNHLEVWLDFRPEAARLLPQLEVVIEDLCFQSVGVAQ